MSNIRRIDADRICHVLTDTGDDIDGDGTISHPFQSREAVPIHYPTQTCAVFVNGIWTATTNLPVQPRGSIDWKSVAVWAGGILGSAAIWAGIAWVMFA